jgi:hypothetical protein
MNEAMDRSNTRGKRDEREKVAEGSSDPGIPHHLSKRVEPTYHSPLLRQSKSLAPLLSGPQEVESIIQRNEHRRAQVELGIYLMLDEPPDAEERALGFLPLTGTACTTTTTTTTRPCYDAEDSSLPDSFSYLSLHDKSSLSSYFSAPRYLDSLLQPFKHWWGSHSSGS